MESSQKIVRTIAESDTKAYKFGSLDRLSVLRWGHAGRYPRLRILQTLYDQTVGRGSCHSFVDLTNKFIHFIDRTPEETWTL